MILVITEKPAVAQSLARVIGADKRNEGYLEGSGYLARWCIGHRMKLAPPEAYDEKLGLMTDGTDLATGAERIINDSKVTDHHAILPTRHLKNAGVLANQN